MTTDEVDRRIESLSRKVKDRADALLELELDPTRELLEKSALTGATAAAWATASAGLAAAWEGRALLDDRMERIRELRGTKSRLNADRLAELQELLDARTLPTPGDPGGRCSPGELLARGSAGVEAGRELMRAVAQRWDTLVPRLTTSSATLRACSELLAELGAAPDDELEDARRELARLTDAVATNPLAATPEPVSELEAKVAAARGRVERVRDFRADAGRRVAEARALLDETHSAHEDAREAREAALTKIVGADGSAPASPPPDLAAELDRAVALADRGAWQEASEALERWRARATQARDEARRVAAANRAPIARRDELRRRLGAYQVKARYLRLLEDPELSDVYLRAHEILYTAPTDVDEAADLVRRYQQGLSAAGPDREVLR